MDCSPHPPSSTSSTSPSTASLPPTLSSLSAAATSRAWARSRR